jgi:hypothetical protein
VRRFEDYRTNISVAFGSPPASAESIEACKARLKAQDWIVDPTLIDVWRVHSTLGACNSTNDEYAIGPYSSFMVGPEEFRLQSAIYDAEDVEFDPADFAELFHDSGDVALAIFRVNKKSNVQAVIDWDHEEPSLFSEGVEDNAGCSIADFVFFTIFSGEDDRKTDKGDDDDDDDDDDCDC